MKIQKKPLSCFILIAFIAHFGFLFYAHNHVLHTHEPMHYCRTYIDDNAFEILKRRERSEILTQIFDQFTNTTLQVKEKLHELKPEFSPTATLAFPEGEPLLFSDDTFSIKQDPLTFLEEPSSISPWEINSLVTSSPLFVTNDIPILQEQMKGFDAYEGLGMIAGSHHFDMKVEYVQKQNRPGYVFKLTLLPKANVHFKRIKQNYFFMLDRSNSIARARYALNKAAVSKALDYLKPQDTFNILIFDDKVKKLAPTTLNWNTENIASARSFLDNEGHGGYFASTELYGLLGKIIPDDVLDTEVNTAILLSDGDTYLSQEKQREIIGGWTKSNMGKVALYAIASGGGNNLPLLDLISSFNKGALVYSYDHEQLEQRLSQLITTIRNPIGKQMVATAIPLNNQTSVILQPKNHRLPDLYQNRPYVIYGTTSRLSDFVVFLQGKYYDQRFDIKKRICFEDAKNSSLSLEKGWTQLVAQEFYERFFDDGNKKHLEAAKHLLSPLNIPIPLQPR